LNVHDHLEAASRLPWRWGGGCDGFEGEDCTLFAANWALALTGRDPGIGFRGVYSTGEEALAIVARAGGLEAFIDQQLRPQGWSRISAPARDGDIGVVMAPLPPKGELGPVPAIRAGGLWIARSLRGHAAYPFEARSVWRWNAGPLADLGPPAPAPAPILSRQALAGETALSPLPRQMQQTGVIESFILLGLTSAGLSGAALNIAVPLLTAVATTGISMGVNMLLGAAFAPKPPRPEDGKAPKSQATPPIIYAVGRNRIGGYYMLWEAKSDRLFAVLALVGHRINRFVSYFLHDDEVTLSAAPNPNYPSMVSVTELDDDRYGEERIAIATRLGAVPETPYQDVVTALSPEGIWTNSHRGDGTASLALICRAPSGPNYQKLFPNGIPQPSTVAETALVWDFRDQGQDPEDPATWTYSENPVLQLAWHYCFNPYHLQRDYKKAILPVLDRWIEEANICDEEVPRASGGTEPRYAAHVWSTTENDPKGFTNALLNACDGWICERGDGAVIPIVGKFREELVETITDADLVGYFLQNDVEEENEVNRLVPKFTYPATDYTTTDTDFFEDVEAQLIAGRPLSTDCDLSAVQEWRQARRLGKREWLRLQQKRRGTLDLRLSAINAVYTRWVRVQSTGKLPRLNGMLIENRRAVIALMKGGFQMEFVQHPENIDTWTPALDEGAAPPVPIKPAQSKVELATIDTLTAVSNGSSVYLRVVVLEPISDSLVPVVLYRLKDAGGGQPGEWIEQEFPNAAASGGLIVLNTNPVIGDKVYQVQAAFKASKGTKGEWRPTPPAEVSTTLNTVAPSALVSASVTAGSNLGNVQFNFVTPSDANIAKVHVYRVPAGAALNKAVHERIVIPANPGRNFSYSYGDPTRTNKIPNGTFADAAGLTVGPDWSVASGVATKVAGTTTRTIMQNVDLGGLVGKTLRYGFDLTRTAGTVNVRLAGGTIVTGPNHNSSGKALGSIAVVAGNNQAGFAGGATFAGSVDNFELIDPTAACAPQGTWDFYAFPANASGIEGPGAPAIAGVVIV
jgi:hypothetical protein